MGELNQRELIALYVEICTCKDCHLPEGYRPMLRPPGHEYKTRGVVFVQINPGAIGFLSNDEIEQKYSSQQNRNIANRKAKDTKILISLQKRFLRKPCVSTYDRMGEVFCNSMSRVWGWPPGKYGSTIEAHGVSLVEAAFLNLAQCPIPNNSYRRHQLDRCWSKWASRILSLLQPALIVAQGKQVLNFIGNHQLHCDVKIVEGLHHADRRSKEVKQKVLTSACKTVQRRR